MDNRIFCENEVNFKENDQIFKEIRCGKSLDTIKCQQNTFNKFGRHKRENTICTFEC